MKNAFDTSKISIRDAPVVQNLTAFGNRATVQRIVWNGCAAVAKRFKPGAERFAAREREILGTFGGQHPAIARLLDAGPLHVVYEYSDNELQVYRRPHGTCFPRPLVPLHIARAAFSALRFFHDRGYALMDFHPGNILYSRRSGLRLIDFEFAYRYECEAPPFEQSYCIAGVPQGFPGDLPETYDWDRTPYDAKWRPYVAVGLDELLSGKLLCVHARRRFHQFHMSLHLQKRWLRSRVPGTALRISARGLRPSG